MPAIKSYLSKKDKADLMQFIAMTGENYDRYLEWCQARSARPFSRGYLHNWISRRRVLINEIRAKQREEIRRQSRYGKDRRLEELEKVAEHLLNTIDQMVIHDVCMPTCKPVDTLVKLMEQHRKTMEAIAKERGEYNKLDQQSDDRDTRALIAKREALARLGTGRKVYIIQQDGRPDELGSDEESVGE